MINQNLMLRYERRAPLQTDRGRLTYFHTPSYDNICPNLLDLIIA